MKSAFYYPALLMACVLWATPSYAAQSVSLPKSVALSVRALCEDGPFDLEGHLLPEKIISYKITPTLFMRLVYCTGGAYNASYLGFWNSGNKWAPFTIPSWSEEGLCAMSSITNPSYDAVHKTLKTFTKYRGMADCGVQGLYKIKSRDDEGAGGPLSRYNTLYAQSIWLKSSCDGEPFLLDKPFLKYSNPHPN